MTWDATVQFGESCSPRAPYEVDGSAMSTSPARM